MRLLTKGKYALRAMVDLACNGKGEPVTLRDIAQRQSISITYLEQLFNQLRRGNLVESVRGPGGGYVLARPATEISAADIIGQVEDLSLTSCTEEDFDLDLDCVRARNCVSRQVWVGLAEAIRGYLKSVTLFELSRQQQELLGITVPTQGESRV